MLDYLFGRFCETPGIGQWPLNYLGSGEVLD